MGLTSDYAGKGSGQLIRSGDWNGLITAVEQQLSELSDRVTSGFETVGARIGSLDTRLDKLDTEIEEAHKELTDFRQSVDELSQGYYRLTLEAPRRSFAIGQLGEIVARVTDLRGEPLRLDDPARRPWVDFVAAWGQLKPMDGYVSRGGAGDRAISVRVDRQGIARVQVRAEHADGVPEQVELQMAAVLETRPVGVKNVGQVLLDAATPLEASLGGAFEVLAKEYDRPDVFHVRKYLDSYYLWQPPVAGDFLVRPPLHSWRDYRSTILAFVKNDADPTTADSSRGVGSIQIKFRDWLSPFLALDYFDFEKNHELIVSTKDALASELVLAKSFEHALRGVKSQVDQTVAGKGLLARQRGYRVINKALEQVRIEKPSAYLPALRQAVGDAVVLQQALEISQLTTTGLDRPVAVDVFTNAALRADQKTAEIGNDLIDLGNQYTQLKDHLTEEFHKEIATKADLSSIADLRIYLQSDINNISKLLNKKVDSKVDNDIFESAEQRIRTELIEKFSKDIKTKASNSAVKNIETKFQTAIDDQKAMFNTHKKMIDNNKTLISGKVDYKTLQDTDIKIRKELTGKFNQNIKTKASNSAVKNIETKFQTAIDDHKTLIGKNKTLIDTKVGTDTLVSTEKRIRTNLTEQLQGKIDLKADATKVDALSKNLLKTKKDMVSIQQLNSLKQSLGSNLISLREKVNGFQVVDPDVFVLNIPRRK